MTAILIACDAAGMLVVTDGIATTYEGIVGPVVSKVALLPQSSGFVAARGYGQSVSSFMALIDQRASTFDELLGIAPDVARELKDSAESMFPEHSDFSIYIGGWSESRERFETYVVSSRAREPQGAPPRAAFELQKLPRTMIAPGPDIAVREQLGLTGINYDNAPLWIHAVRLSSGVLGGPDMDEACAVGGYIQRISILRNAAHSQVLFRYDDAFDEPLTPKPGETEALRAILDLQ